MSGVYRKVFKDRYALLREHQILDVLNQRRAPVPRVILSHVAEGYLDMSDGGLDLVAWVRRTAPPEATLAQALAEALEALVAVAHLGVWHLDVALRNFVVQSDAATGQPRVQVIDFSNAVAEQFPLQKPLWMLPAGDQHPELRQALAADWAAFFDRHQLPRPNDWQDTFDVPLALYQEDWGCDFAVEAMGLRWCILAHGCAAMLQQFERAAGLPPQAIAELMDLRDEARAEAGLKALATNLRRLGSASAATPRPRATGSATSSLPSAPLVPPVVPLSPARPMPAAPVSVAVPAPLAQPADQPSLAPAVTPRRFPARWVAGAVLVAVGWWHIDALYTQHRLLLWGWGWACLMAGFALTLMAVLCMAMRRRLQPWLGLVLITQLVTQGLLLLELWVRRVPLLW